MLTLCLITGVASDTGYCEGEVDGRKGLVPVLYLVPYKHEDTPTQQPIYNQQVGLAYFGRTAPY